MIKILSTDKRFRHLGPHVWKWAIPVSGTFAASVFLSISFGQLSTPLTRTYALSLYHEPLKAATKVRISVSSWSDESANQHYLCWSKWKWQINGSVTWTVLRETTEGDTITSTPLTYRVFTIGTTVSFPWLGGDIHEVSESRVFLDNKPFEKELPFITSLR